MQLIDSHVHIETDIHNTSEDLDRNGISKALVYLNDGIIPKERPDNIILGTTINYLSDVKKAYKKGIRIIKMLPYEQRITLNKLNDEYYKSMKFMQKHGMILSMCSTYGSKLLYKTNGLQLAFAVKEDFPDIPIILAHGGGPRVFDAMTLMLEYPDVYMDLSFSLKYWWESSVIDDYAFALRKLKGKNVLYGSDYPYVSFAESLNYFLYFAKVKNIIYTEDICYNNFKKFEELHLEKS